jgi:hypothetical protein
MSLDIFKEKGIPLDQQLFTWRELVQAPTSKLDDDAFTRVRIILMNGLEANAIRTSHAMARMMNSEMRLALAKEGTVARTLERQTAKIPSDVFLWAALGSIGTSAILRLMGKKNASLFVGDWVAPFMLFGVYNKIVKTQGSDRLSH